MEKILTFKVGNEKFCISISNVIGIDQKTKISAVPMASKHHIGMMNLRGQIIPVVDLRLLFQVQAKENEKEQCNIFIETESQKMACLVDAVYDVVECKNDKALLATGDKYNSDKDSFVLQTLNINNEIIFQLNTNKIYNSISNENQIHEKKAV